jgi:hypothetical protein
VGNNGFGAQHESRSYLRIVRNLASHHTWRALIQNGCSMRATAQYTFANHCRTYLCCVDPCACVFRPSAAVLAVLVFLPGALRRCRPIDASHRPAGHELRRVSPIRVSNNSFFPDSTLLHFRPALGRGVLLLHFFFTPERLPISRPLTGPPFVRALSR